MGALKNVTVSRSDADWREAKAYAAFASEKPFAGFIFVCNNTTFSDRRPLFGLPARHKESVRAIRKGMPLFLYNYSTRRLHGVFEAASDGGYNLDPYAWENIEDIRNGPGVSIYPAQVRYRVRFQAYPLEEEMFRPVLDREDGRKFRLMLTYYQVQQLLQLFRVGGSKARPDDINVRSNGNSHYLPAIPPEPGSPNFGCKFDSDSYSDSSGGVTTVYEDEWLDEMVGHSIDPCLSRENMEVLLSQQTGQLTIGNFEGNADVLTNSRLPKQFESPSYSAALMSGVPNGSQESMSTLIEGKTKLDIVKGSFRKPAQRIRSELDENSVLLRLHEVDPAVNSNSINYAEPGGHQTHSLTDQETMSRTLLVQSQGHPPVAGGENVFFIPIPTVHCHQGGMSNFASNSQKSTGMEERQFSCVWSGQNTRRQSLTQDKLGRQEVKSNLHKQHVASENQHVVITPPPKFQLGQIVVPLCLQRPVPFYPEQGHVAALVSPVFISTNGQSLPLVQPQLGSSTDDPLELYETMGDSALHREGLQNLLQNGHLGVQVPLLLVPSVLPRISGASAPIAKVDVEVLHCEILEFAKMARPTPEAQLHAEAAIDCVRKGVKRVWPEADVEVFGSFATGLCLRHSDVDLAVVGAPLAFATETLSLAKASVSLIRELAAALGGYDWCESINVLDTASMPVLKCHCRPPVSLYDSSTSSSIAVDITIGGTRGSDFGASQNYTGLDPAGQIFKIGKSRNRHTGGAAREYVLQKILDLPALGPLVLLLKSYLHHRGLSVVYSGGLGSFSLTLLLAFYLERIPITCGMLLDRMPVDLPVSPTTTSPLSCSSEFSEDSDTSSSTSSCAGLISDCGTEFGGCTRREPLVRRAADVMDRVLGLWNVSGLQCLGTLLLGFLQTFGFELDLSTVKIVLKGADGTPGGTIPRDNSTRHIALWIDDPLRPGVNIGAGSFGIFHVQVAFQEMLQVLTNHNLCISAPHSQGKVYSDIAVMGQLQHLVRLFDCDEDDLS